MKTIFTALALIALIIVNSVKLNAQVNVQDSLALVDLYNATNGPGWTDHTNWLTTNPVSSWHGVTVSDNRVITLFLGSNHLKGSLPNSIGDLGALTWLLMSFDSLSGSIPTSVGNLSALQYLTLDFNQLTGNIPPSIGNLTQLLELDLYKNQLTGTVPSSFSNLTSLQNLGIHFNNLSGPFPAVICDIPSLVILKLEFNQFTGHMPNAIGRLVNLVILEADDNQFNGAIPDSLFTLPILQLIINNNQFSGSIPANFGDLHQCEIINFSNNQLSGRIPVSIGNIQATSINLSNNRLSGNLPATIGKISSLSYLDIDNNRLTITPDVVFDLSLFPYLRELDFKSNRFTFNGIETIEQNFPYKFTYSPQAVIPVHAHGNTLAVSAGGTLSNNTYTWFKVGGTGNTVITADSTFQPAESGDYFVRITNAIATKLTLRSDTFSYVVPLAVSSNASKQPAKTSLLIYPNPVKDNVVHVQCSGNAKIIIVDAAGHVMMTRSIIGSTAINIASLANGLYYLKNINTGETKRFEVSR
jgi:Leucine-rich repeat (LRR) protein